MAEHLLRPASTEEKHAWGGFCEIESEPALFNALLHDLGVRHVHVREVISLDDDSLASLPSVTLALVHLLWGSTHLIVPKLTTSSCPVYGLVLLFQWCSEETVQQEQSCPENIWFANQTMSGACASVALLNLVNNISNLDLGEHLSAFREYTQTLSPADKGDAVANYAFVKEAHNAFARKIDIQNVDLSLSHEASKGRKDGHKKTHKDIDDAAFHFIAFMPIENHLWKLDGLERQPLCLTELNGEDWLRKTRPELEARMLQCQEENLNFVLLSLTQDPLIGISVSLMNNISTLNAVESKLDVVRQDWRLSGSDDHEIAHMASLSELRSAVGEGVMQRSYPLLSQSDYTDLNDIEILLTARRDLIEMQGNIRMDLRECQQNAAEETRQAEARRHDFGARVQRFARFVNEKGRLYNT